MHVRRVHRAVALAAALLVMTTGMSSGSTASAATPTLALRAGALQAWAPAHMTGRDAVNMTREIAVATAKAYDVVAGTEKTFGAFAADMKAANPRLRLLLYMNGVYAQKSEGSKYPESWYAHDAKGRRVQSVRWGNYMMNLRETGWHKDRQEHCRNGLARTGFHYCYVDMFGLSPLLSGYNTGLPIDPKTGKVWTARNLLAANVAVGKAIESTNGGFLAANGFAGGKYFKTPSPALLFETVDAGHAEVFLRFKDTPPTAFKSETDWKRDVDMVVDIGRRGKVAMTTTKLWLADPTPAQIEQWHKYSVASFLLGTDGRSYFHFSVKNDIHGILDVHGYDRVDVGAPSGAYAKSNGVYRRNFTKGIVLVNPTGSTVTVSLGGRFKDLTGQLRRSVTLKPNTGEVLTKA